ncbi:hypothetical protein VHAB30_03150 [Variovorax boronicumulans]|nr:hypothetical protein VHAB30_03150 [Variovorax boronicumulans]
MHNPISPHMSERTETPRAWEAAFVKQETIYLPLVTRGLQVAAAAMRHHLQASRVRWSGESVAPGG